jgi:hypothetical protein
MLKGWKKRVLSPLAVIAVGLTVGVSACAPAPTTPTPTGVNPINGYNKPTKPAGLTNGKIPTANLATYSTKCKTWGQAYGSLSAMVLAAKKVNVSLVPADCYRDYAGQVYWRTWWCNLGKCANAAVPGTSNHGWGKAVDMHDLSGGLPTTGAAYKWMKANAGRFGWINPILTNEAWHWEWVGDGGTMGGYKVRPGLFTYPLKSGMKNDEVALLQRTLIAKGYKLTADGSFGATTLTAVKSFQTKNKITADGIVGNGTAWALRMFS